VAATKTVIEFEKASAGGATANGYYAWVLAKIKVDTAIPSDGCIKFTFKDVASGEPATTS
jgi:hypothetical protein